MDAEQLLAGAYDLHIHTGPDVIGRKLDDFEMAERMQKAGMKGFGIKSHYFCTAERAALTKKLYPDVNVVGAICLNNTVGGLNPMAVEIAARDGAKIVWMPTFDSLNEQEHFKTAKHDKLPFWAKMKMELEEQGKTMPNISLLDESGTLKRQVLDIMDIAAHHSLVLATGHISVKEIYALVEESAKRKMKKTVITHPNFPSSDLSKEQIKELADKGAIMEFCFTTPYTDKVTWESVYEQIRYVGPENCILSTDLGQPQYVYPDEGMKMFISNLLQNGFSAEEVRIMTNENPTFLAEI
ncbi:DUF6282 family protein [Paenibacillus validus]|uniref:Cytosolic protein n=1 Tax=Paenibacillus validus TaxID=44253 RepID=A0A7X2ZC46_9BACL|nr:MULTISPECIES: DUF6282 family protein [Paenibacillus]MED4601952.1 DUF6282 family protein [Paenibacillus validus]MED4606855.1 DUF6282 family protein [Paenibacillus validus]MUG72268.1 cytosolic protein [Paenibacillus validus]